jgi:hypothetical protein
MPDEPMSAKFAWLAVTCLSYGITFFIAKTPGADTYTWIGGGLTFFLMGLMIRQVFNEASFLGAYGASAFFCMIIMYPLNLFFTVLMGLILAIIVVFGIAVIASENERNRQNNF